MYIIIVLLFWNCLLYAPYDYEYIKLRKKKQFFVRWDPQSESFVKIRVRSCIIDEEHTNPPKIIKGAFKSSLKD
jgi:hypothetical protein